MKKNKLVIFSFLLLSLGACKKVIDVKETDFIGGDIALKTVANNESGIIGAYAAMNVEMGILLNATFADEVKPGEFYNAATTHEWQYSSQDVGLRDNYTAFNLYYRIIDRVNRVLIALPNAVAANATEAALKERLRGEALFLRALCHFELYKYYSNTSVGSELAVAYMETPSLVSTARITLTPFVAKLKADIAADIKDIAVNEEKLEATIFTGKKGLRMLFDEMIEVGKPISIIASNHQFKEFFGPYFELWHKMRIERGIRQRSIFPLKFERMPPFSFCYLSKQMQKCGQ